MTPKTKPKKLTPKQQAENVYKGQIMAQFGETPESVDDWIKRIDQSKNKTDPNHADENTQEEDS